jgi:hypothetical protein
MEHNCKETGSKDDINSDDSKKILHPWFREYYDNESAI